MTLKSLPTLAGILSLGILSACHQNAAPTSSTSFENVPSAPSKTLVIPATAAPTAAATHVPAECPKFSGKFIQDGQEAYVVQESDELGSSYTIFGSSTLAFVADGKVHLGPQQDESTYVAECKSGEMKVTVSPLKNEDEGTLMHFSLKSFTDDGDFKLSTWMTGKPDMDKKTEELFFLNAVRKLTRSKHVSSECPIINGDFGAKVGGYAGISMTTFQRAGHTLYIADKQQLIADGIPRTRSDGGKFETYVASCSSNQLKVEFGQRGAPVAVLTLKPAADDTLDMMNIENGKLTAHNFILLQPSVPPSAAAPAPEPVPAPVQN